MGTELQELQEQRAAEIAEFNAGWEHARTGGSIKDDPDPPEDQWRSGFEAGVYERLQAIVGPLEELTKDSAASVLFYIIAGCVDGEDHSVCINELQPPLPSYFYGKTYAEALVKAVEAKRKESES